MSKTVFVSTTHAKVDKTKQDFSSKYPGSSMVPEVFLVHSTEGTGWPDYSGGSMTPNMTIMADFKNQRVLVRQHIPANRSSRALENRAGGVETNTQNVFQVELVATCDPATHKKWKAAGIQHIYTPEAPDWFILGVAEVLDWLHDDWGLKIQDAAPRGWVGPEKSPARLDAPQRLSFKEWNAAYGVLGHQHVPENGHWDPGAFPVAKLIAAAKGLTPAPTPAPTPKPTPAPAAGPSVTSASLNAACYNAEGAATYKPRTDRYVKRRLASLVDVINLQELGNGINRKTAPNALMRGRLDKGFGKTYRRHIGADGRYCYSNPATVKPIKSGVITAAKSTWFNGDDKQAAYLVFEKDGVRGMDVSFHLENEDGATADAKRPAQLLSIVAQALVIAKAQKVDLRNILFIGDTNSEGTVAATMAAAGWRNVAAGTPFENTSTYIGWDGRERKRFDYAFVYKTAAAADVNAIHADPDVADHAELVVRRQLTRA